MNKSRRFKALVPGEATRLLSQWRAGDSAAFDRLLPIVYQELRQLASSYMRSERPDHLLQTTALVHEAYLRLVDRSEMSCETRSDFFAVAAQVMRHVLVDYARARTRAKRGGGVPPVSLEDVAVISGERAEEVLAVDAALEGLMSFDLRKGTIFELRHFGGLSVEEAAQVLRVSPSTVARDWRMAKAWLRRAIASESHRGS
ncbi:MAG TPA: sigma-70 family RNA polymerase sigma factor [Steroidobacteraceae bacterium]|jgi:RNA polymerase sigma factor (TIGR02999 family)|nr:sigma-70 family RNA polymerase sigma factor [Steroidobacteraceae bacterium]